MPTMRSNPSLVRADRSAAFTPALPMTASSFSSTSAAALATLSSEPRSSDSTRRSALGTWLRIAVTAVLARSGERHPSSTRAPRVESCSAHQ